MEIDIWAKSFAEDLLIAGTTVPIDRVLGVHLDTIKVLRKRGVTWTGLSLILTRGGARRADGGAISAGQLRAAVSRLIRNGTKNEPKQSPRLKSSKAAPQTPNKPLQSPEQHRRELPPPPSLTALETVHLMQDLATSKDLTDDEITAALHRIGRRTP